MRPLSCGLITLPNITPILQPPIRSSQYSWSTYKSSKATLLITNYSSACSAIPVSRVSCLSHIVAATCAQPTTHSRICWSRRIFKSDHVASLSIFKSLKPSSPVRTYNQYLPYHHIHTQWPPLSKPLDETRSSSSSAPNNPQHTTARLLPLHQQPRLLQLQRSRPLSRSADLAALAAASCSPSVESSD